MTDRKGREIIFCRELRCFHQRKNRELFRRGLGTGSLSENEIQYWVYILENSVGKFYIGSTCNLIARVAQHNDPERDRTHYTAKHRPWRGGSWRTFQVNQERVAWAG